MVQLMGSIAAVTVSLRTTVTVAVMVPPCAMVLEESAVVTVHLEFDAGVG